MLKFDKKCCKKESEIFKALGHPTRLWIVEQLAAGERCVCELVEAVGVDFSTISKHLSILKQVDIIEDDKRGKQVYYTLCCPCIIEILECVRKRNK